TKYAIDVYLSPAGSDASRKGGKTFLKTLSVTTPKTSGHVMPVLTITDSSKSVGQIVTATATNLTALTTSEYSNSVAIP
ncbi:MAG: hypothetical protein JWO94_2156, partial [Verrucomicrobiaceae bacterium]|nr:hypothetical protein [Verrucomicrobiaceae bacterium]